jgi:hypothetical protein
MKTLVHLTWTLFAADALLTAAMVVAAITDKGDAAGRGLGLAFTVFGVIALAVLALVAGLSTYFKTRIGLGFSVALEAAPPAFLVYEAVGRIATRLLS